MSMLFSVFMFLFILWLTFKVVPAVLGFTFSVLLATVLAGGGNNFFATDIGSAVLGGGCGAGVCDNRVVEIDFLI